MKVFIGADHRGFKLKEFCKAELGDKYEMVDCGAVEWIEGDDYVEYAVGVAEAVTHPFLAEGEGPLLIEGKNRGIVICGSGVGVDVVANKVKGVRCGLGLNVEQVRAARHDDDINVLALAADFVSEEEAKEMVEAFLTTEFSGEERHVRRIRKISTLEKRD